MSNDGDNAGKRTEALAKAGEIGATAAMAAATATGSATTAALAGFVAILPQAIGAVIPGFLRLQAKRVDRWWATVTRGDDDDDQDFEDEIHRRILEEDEEVVATIMASLRTLLESLDSASVIPLARLTRAYLKEGKSADLFFRGMTEILSQIRAAELSALRGVLDAMCAAETAVEGDAFVALAHRPLGLSDTYAPVRSTDGVETWFVGYYRYDPGKERSFEPMQQLPHAPAAFAMLKAAGFAFDPGGTDSSAGPYALSMERALARRIRGLL